MCDYWQSSALIGHSWGDYLTIILRGHAGYEMIYITNEARSAELVMIISYPARPSRIIVLLKTPTSQLFYVEFIWPFFLGAAKRCICCCVHWPYLVEQVYELITCVRRANENAGNVISVVQFLIICDNHLSGFSKWPQAGLSRWQTKTVFVLKKMHTFQITTNVIILKQLFTSPLANNC